MDRKIIKLLGPNKAYNFYIITWTNFKGRQSLLGFKTYICWDRTAVVHDRTFLTKVIYIQICFHQKFRDNLNT